MEEQPQLRSMAELNADLVKVMDAVDALAKVMNGYFQMGAQTGPAQVYAYEANRKLEEVAHRINDSFVLRAQRSKENMERLTQEAFRKAGATGESIVAVDGAPIVPIAGVPDGQG